MRKSFDLSCSVFILLLCIALQPLNGALAGDDQTAERKAMVTTQIVARGVKDPVTLAAMREVPRHKFVPPVQTFFAYDDRPLPIGFPHSLGLLYSAFTAYCGFRLSTRSSSRSSRL